jgi:hypothetical protein
VTADLLSAQVETLAWDVQPEFLKSGEASYPIRAKDPVNIISILESIIASPARYGEAVKLCAVNKEVLNSWIVTR